VVLERLGLEARRLLAFSRLPVNEIANAMGFEDTAYFCRFFKRTQGVTPSGYRASVAAEPGKVQ
jgi:AraC family transcriptional activator of pobA